MLLLLLLFATPLVATGLSKCQTEYEKAKNIPGFTPPKCNADGSYANSQCIEAFNVCWCVDSKTGKTIPGTMIKIKGKERPKCGLSKCQKEYEKAKERIRAGIQGVSLPKCNTDGSYAKVQCIEALNVCWCVDSKTGNEIPGTKRNKKPNERPTCVKGKCEDLYEKVGCYHAGGTYPIKLNSDVKPFWINSRQWLKAQTCKCAKLAAENNYPYFGIQNDGECWSGPSKLFNRDLKSDRCIMYFTWSYKRCKDHARSLCTGQKNTNYIYRNKEYKD